MITPGAALLLPDISENIIIMVGAVVIEVLLQSALPKQVIQIFAHRNRLVSNKIKKKSNVHGVAIFLAVSYLKK